MKQRIILILTIIALLASPVFAATKHKNTETDKKIAKIESYIYGGIQSGKTEDRLNQIEEDLFGRTTGQKVSEKAKYIYKLLFKGTSDSPSLDMKLSFLEWKLFNKTVQGNLETRLAKLDKQIIGTVSMEPMAFRLEQLVQLTINTGFISMLPVTIEEGTRIKLKLAKEISSRRAKKGDIVQFKVADDMFVNDNVLSIAKGGIINARVKSVRRGGRFGRSGYVNLEIKDIEAIDTTSIPVELANSAQEKYNKKKIGLAIGASTVGYVVLGPIGIVGGAFIKGKDVTIPANTVVEVRTTAEKKIQGVIVNKK